MARTDLAVAGCGFVALHGGTAMLHAVEVRADRRREGGGDHGEGEESGREGSRHRVGPSGHPPVARG